MEESASDAVHALNLSKVVVEAKKGLRHFALPFRLLVRLRVSRSGTVHGSA